MGNESSNINKLKIKGKRYLDRGYFDKASDIFEQILKIEPENLFALDKIGVISARRGVLDEAEYYFNKVLSIDHRYKTALNNLGNVYLERGEYEHAKSCYSRAIEIDENYAQVYHNLAIAYKKEGDIYNYLKNLKKSVRLAKRQTLGKVIRWFRG
ncbi:MAG: hypothetical protein A7315_03405 [Candidatus Altiarchaeales archaeon WOR_SM1_79]|nr:MAG: hypothetical protein A7315_03405 [Candidatus Altiarchaeales archaeon WOR_SM1_79]